MAISPTLNGKAEVTLGRLVEDALNYLYRAEERPLVVFVGSDDLDSDVDNKWSLTADQAAQVHPTDLIEGGHELMLVTNKTEDAEPVLTVQRAYAGTPNEGVFPPQSVMLKNPRWKRHDVWRSLLQGMRGTVGAALPMTKEVVLTCQEGGYLELPSEALGVMRVGVGVGPDDRIRWTDEWEHRRDYSRSSTGQSVEVSTGLQHMSFDDFTVRYIVPYSTKGPSDTTWDETALPLNFLGEGYSVELWEGTEDVFSLYAAAVRLTGREMSRSDVTEMEQWNSDNASRVNVNVTVARFMWQNFYLRLDEMKNLHAKSFEKHRPYRRRINARALKWSY